MNSPTATVTSGSAALPSRNRLSPQAAALRLYEIVESRVAGDCEDPPVPHIVQIAAELTGALGVVYLERNADQRLVIQPDKFAPSNLVHLRSLLQHVMRLATVAAAESSPQAGTTEADPGLVVAAVPVFGGPGGTEALAMAMSVESPDQARATSAYLVQMLTWIADTISCHHQLHGSNGNAASETCVRDLHSMLIEATQQADRATRYRLIADWVKHSTASSEVLLSWRTRGCCRVVGYAGHEKFDPRSDRIAAAEELSDEIVIAAEHGLDPHSLGTAGDTAAAKKLSQLTGKRITQTHVLNDAMGVTRGVLVCLDQDCRTTEGSANSKLAPDIVGILGHHLHSMQQAEPGWLKQQLLRGKTARNWTRQPVFWAALTAVCVLMLIPLPLKVSTPCVVQPKQRRFLSVPYEGRLEQSLTKPGDVVSAGQVLAKMDRREIQWEISTLQADLQSAEKSRDAALADSQTSAAQIAALEAKRLRLQIRELEERMANLEIRSPVDGVVVSGDPNKLEGARFSIGETLLEVAPLTNMLVELEIADEDVSHVRAGQSVTYRLAASPLHAFEGVIQTIQPRSEIRDNQNVFVAFVEIENADDQLRPGMRGRAKISCDAHCLGWNLFHKAAERVASWVMW